MDFNRFYSFLDKMRHTPRPENCPKNSWANLNLILNELGFSADEVEHAVNYCLYDSRLCTYYHRLPTKDIMMTTMGLSIFAAYYTDFRVSFIMASLIQMGYR